jgi:hypothetical protein
MAVPAICTASMAQLRPERVAFPAVSNDEILFVICSFCPLKVGSSTLKDAGRGGEVHIVRTLEPSPQKEHAALVLAHCALDVLGIGQFLKIILRKF